MTESYELTADEAVAFGDFSIGAKSPNEIQDTAGPNWLIEEWLVTSATMLSAQPEVGKSTLAAHLAAAVANGTEWHGKPVQTDREGPVLIVVSDPGDSRSWSDKGIALGVTDDKWRITTFDPKKWDDIIGYVVDTDCPLLVFDNISGALSGGINDADPQELLRPLTMVVDTGTPVLALAHTGKGIGNTPIGPTAYWAWRRHGLEMSSTGDIRKVIRKGNQDKYPDVFLNKAGEAVEGPTKRANGTPNRATKTLETNKSIAAFVVQHCQALTTEVAGIKVADKFGGAPSTHKKNLSSTSGALSKLLTRSGKGPTTKWELRAT